MKEEVSVEDRVILFTDIHNFSMVEMALGGQGYRFLQQAYEELGDIIVEHHGEIVKYMGDALLCTFPAGSEKQAVACSLTMRESFRRIADSRNIPSDTELEIGIGSGRVTVGVFGHASLRQKDVFGQEVNRAARIGHYRGIAVTEAAHGRIADHYETERLPDIDVKWQDEPLAVWRVIE